MSVRDLFVRMRVDHGEFDVGLGSAGKSVSKFESNLQGGVQGLKRFGGALDLLAAGGITFVGEQALKAAWDLGVFGARALAVERNLEAFAGSAQTASQWTDAVVEAAGRGVSDLAAESAALKFLQMNLADSASQMAVFVEGATRLGNQEQSASQRIEEMTQLLKNLNVNMLDNFGLSRGIVMARTQELQATQGLTREQGMLQAIQEEITRQLVVLGPRAEDAAAAIDEMTAASENAKLALAEMLAPAVGAVAQEIPGAILRIQLLTAVIAGQISASTAWTAAAESQRIEQEQGAAAAKSYVDMVIKMGQVVEQATNVHGEWNTVVAKSGEVALTAAQGLGLLTSAFGQSIAAIGSHMVDLVPEDAIKGWKYLQAEQSRVRDEFIRNAATRGLAEVDAAETATDAWSSYFDAQQKGYDDLRNTIRSALSPTQVTDLDMGLSETGNYADKWDENARRLDAIAARGFEELDAHPDWSGILKIPEDVLQAGPAALQNWAGQMADSVRNLERPDLLNIDAALQAVQQEINRKAAQELSLDIVTQAAVNKGMVTGPDAKAQVAQMLGISTDEPLSVPAKLEFVMPEGDDSTAGVTGAGTAVGDGLMAGVSLAIAGTDAVAMFAAQVRADMEENRRGLELSGEALWVVIEKAMYEAMRKTPFVHKFARLISPYVADILEDQL